MAVFVGAMQLFFSVHPDIARIQSSLSVKSFFDRMEQTIPAQTD